MTSATYFFFYGTKKSVNFCIIVRKTEVKMWLSCNPGENLTVGRISDRMFFSWRPGLVDSVTRRRDRSVTTEFANENMSVFDSTQENTSTYCMVIDSFSLDFRPSVHTPSFYPYFYAQQNLERYGSIHTPIMGRREGVGVAQHKLMWRKKALIFLPEWQLATIGRRPGWH